MTSRLMREMHARVGHITSSHRSDFRLYYMPALRDLFVTPIIKHGEVIYDDMLLGQRSLSRYVSYLESV